MDNFNIETLYLPFDYDNSERRVRIYLPENYESSNKRYPVLYMLDGQNVFFDEESYSGMSWRAILALKQTKLDDKMIIVAVDHADENRFYDYSPYLSDFPIDINGVQHYNGHGHLFADFLVNTLKPVIDETYPTLSSRKYTAVCGSSLGGLMTAFLGSKHTDVFKFFGVFSLASYFCKTDFINSVSSNPIRKKSFYYIQTGTEEGLDENGKGSKSLSQEYINSSIDYCHALVKARVDVSQISLNIHAFEIHREKYWALHLPKFLNLIKTELNLPDE
jgi:predicted alpha/beta superfamily hydrolase